MIMSASKLRRGPSRPARGAWIEMGRGGAAGAGHQPSRPARGAWIEISDELKPNTAAVVAPRKGRVD